MRRLIKISLPLLGLLLCILAVSKAYRKATDGFHPSYLYSPFAARQEWDIEVPSMEEWQKIDQILNQSFHYLGRGGQSYAFFSENRKWVLKFFKFKYLKPHFLIENLPPISPFKEWRDQERVRKQKKIERAFDGYHLAFKAQKQESGLLFIHLNQTEHLNKNVLLHDKLGKEFQIDLDNVPFILQKMTTNLGDHVSALLQQGKITHVEQCLDQLISFYRKRYELGIFDRDCGVMHNMGISENQFVHFDVGKLTLDNSVKTPEKARNDLLLVFNWINQWFKKQHPTNAAHFQQFLEQKLEENFANTYSSTPP